MQSKPRGRQRISTRRSKTLLSSIWDRRRGIDGGARGLKRGEVYWARLAPRSGSEQTGRRPVIVLSHDAFNKVPTWRSVIVVPVSSSLRQAGRGPTAVPLPAGVGGLERRWRRCVSPSHHTRPRQTRREDWTYSSRGHREDRRWTQSCARHGVNRGHGLSVDYGRRHRARHAGWWKRSIVWTTARVARNR